MHQFLIPSEGGGGGRAGWRISRLSPPFSFPTSKVMTAMSFDEEDIALDVSGALYEGLQEDVEAAGLFGDLNVSIVICNKCEI
jgi:hypothetical protein